MEVYGEPITGDAFHDRRRTGIGGSDTGAILGISPYSSALALWEMKRGYPDDKPASERMVWGTRLQNAILDGYAEDTGRPIRRGVFRRHATHPFIIGHPDAIADDRLIEVKTTAVLDARWGVDGSDEVPGHYYSQVQHYLILTGLAIADLVTLVGGRELHVHTIPASPEFQEALLDEEAAFWKLVQTGEPPDPDGSESAGATLRRMFPRVMREEVVATPEVTAYADAYIDAKRRRDEAQAEMDHDAQLMQRFMGARERLVGQGFSASWSARAGAISWKGVAAAYRDLLPDDVDADAIESSYRGEPSRPFTFTRRRSDER